VKMTPRLLHGTLDVTVYGVDNLQYGCGFSLLKVSVCVCVCVCVCVYIYIYIYIYIYMPFEAVRFLKFLAFLFFLVN
jgi:hypothetical protein